MITAFHFLCVISSRQFTLGFYPSHPNRFVMVNLPSQYDWIGSYPGEMPLGMSGRVFPREEEGRSTLNMGGTVSWLEVIEGIIKVKKEKLNGAPGFGSLCS